MSAHLWTVTFGTDTSLRDVLAGKEGNTHVWTTSPGEALLKCDGQPVALLTRSGYSSRADVEALAKRIVDALNATTPDTLATTLTREYAENMARLATNPEDKAWWTGFAFARTVMGAKAVTP